MNSEVLKKAVRSVLHMRSLGEEYFGVEAE
jgi:hypothetical protein